MLTTVFILQLTVVFLLIDSHGSSGAIKVSNKRTGEAIHSRPNLSSLPPSSTSPPQQLNLNSLNFDSNHTVSPSIKTSRNSWKHGKDEIPNEKASDSGDAKLAPKTANGLDRKNGSDHESTTPSSNSQLYRVSTRVDNCGGIECHLINLGNSIGEDSATINASWMDDLVMFNFSGGTIHPAITIISDDILQSLNHSSDGEKQSEEMRRKVSEQQEKRSKMRTHEMLEKGGESNSVSSEMDQREKESLSGEKVKIIKKIPKIALDSYSFWKHQKPNDTLYSDVLKNDENVARMVSWNESRQSSAYNRSLMMANFLNHGNASDFEETRESSKATTTLSTSTMPRSVDDGAIQAGPNSGKRPASMDKSNLTVNNRIIGHPSVKSSSRSQHLITYSAKPSNVSSQISVESYRNQSSPPNLPNNRTNHLASGLFFQSPNFSSGSSEHHEKGKLEDSKKWPITNTRTIYHEKSENDTMEDTLATTISSDSLSGAQHASDGDDVVSNHSVSSRKKQSKDRIEKPLSDTSENDDPNVLLTCPANRHSNINWPATALDSVAVIQCAHPYTGSAYRSCDGNSSWKLPDLSECRIPHLREIQNLIFYHVHKHLVDGLYPLTEELCRLVTSNGIQITSPMDKLEALDALNEVLKARVKIRLQEEKRDVTFIKALVSCSEQLLTRTPLHFTSEMEKNSLITLKSIETIMGIKALSESILRALIVICNNGEYHPIRLFDSGAHNIVISLAHITPSGTRISLLQSRNGAAKNGWQHSGGKFGDLKSTKPMVKMHSEDFGSLGTGLAKIWFRNIGNYLNSESSKLISDLISVSAVPPVSIEVNFAQTPKVELELRFNEPIGLDQIIKCARIKLPKDMWADSECETISRNVSGIRCYCRELGVFGAILLKQTNGKPASFTDDTHTENYPHSASSSASDGIRGHHSHPYHHLSHFNSYIIYLSSFISLILIMATLGARIHYRIGGDDEASSSSLSSSASPSPSSYIIVNMLITMALIQLIFLFGGPFKLSAAYLSDENEESQCKMIAMLLHYLHLVASFWMLSYSLHMYSRLWKYNDDCEDLISTYEDELESAASSSSTSAIASLAYPQDSACNGISWRPSNCAFSHKKSAKSSTIFGFAVFSWIVPIFCVIISYYINPPGYETRRYCWMSIGGGMMYSFIVPVSFLMMTNTAIMLMILRRFFAFKSLIHKSEIEKVEPSLRSGVSLLPFFSVNWFLSVLALESTATSVFQYLFAISNIIQHLLIIIFHLYQTPEVDSVVKCYLRECQKRADEDVVVVIGQNRDHSQCEEVSNVVDEDGDVDEDDTDDDDDA